MSHARTRLKGDSIVNSVINSTLGRKSQYTRKKSTTIEAEATFTAAIHSTTVDDSPPIFTGENVATQQYTFNTIVRTEVKKIMCLENTEKWHEHVKTLSVQGNFQALAAAEKEDVVWKLYMYNQTGNP